MSEGYRQEFKTIRVAGVQATPVFLNLDATTDKACRLILEAAKAGAELIAFPEAFIPTFPNWYETLGESAKARELDKRLFLESVEMDGEHVRALAEACAQGNINAVIGINERNPMTSGGMHNTQIHINNQGVVSGKHQKYVPTTGERHVHMPGRTGHDNAFRASFGMVSGLICGENSNMLGMYAAAVNYPLVHVSSWPMYFHPYFHMQHAILTATAGLAYSLKCFVVNAVSRITPEYIDAVAQTEDQRAFLEEQRVYLPGASIIGPSGHIIIDGTGMEEELLFADINLEDVIIPKMIIDTAGHYNRPELFASLFNQ